MLLIIDYYSKDKIINQKLTDIFAFQKKSKKEISDTIRNEVQASTTSVKDTVQTHVSQVKDKLHVANDKITGLQQTAQNISQTTHKTHDEVHGLRQDTNYYAQKMISNQNAHFNNIQNSLQYLSSQNMAVVGRLIKSIENGAQNNHNNNIRYQALPPPATTNVANNHMQQQAPSTTKSQSSMSYYPRKLGNDFLHLSSPSSKQHVSASHHLRSQSYHNTPPAFTSVSPRNVKYMNRHSSDSNIGCKNRSTQRKLHGRSKQHHQFRSVPQTPSANQYYDQYYDHTNNNEVTVLSPMSSVRRSSTIKKDTIVTTRELVHDIETSHSHTPSQRVLPNVDQQKQSTNVPNLKHSKSQSPKGWNRWFSGL